jgi:hypothetical protein
VQQPTGFVEPHIFTAFETQAGDIITAYIELVKLLDVTADTECCEKEVFKQ